MIIITGMDNSGKTTIANRLAQEFNLEIIKSLGPTSREVQQKWIEDNIGRVAIFDRFAFIEELVYGPVLRGRQHFFLEDDYGVRLLKERPIIIYTRPPMRKILDFGDRPQMEGVKKSAVKLIRQYDEVIQQMIELGWRVVAYNYMDDSPQELIKFLREEFENG